MDEVGPSPRWLLVTPRAQGGQGWSREDSENCGQAWGPPCEARAWGWAWATTLQAPVPVLQAAKGVEVQVRVLGPTSGSPEARP